MMEKSRWNLLYKRVSAIAESTYFRRPLKFAPEL